MKILVINNTDKKDAEIGAWIDELFERYIEICEKRIPYQINFAKEELKNKVNEINEDKYTLFDSMVLFLSDYRNKEVLDFADDLDYSDWKIVILMESAKTKYPWGEANDFIAVIKRISKSNLWHEMSHLFDVTDHYNENKEVCCQYKKCLMSYGNETEVFCEDAKEEIRRYFGRS